MVRNQKPTLLQKLKEAREVKEAAAKAKKFHSFWAKKRAAEAKAKVAKAKARAKVVKRSKSIIKKHKKTQGRIQKLKTQLKGKVAAPYAGCGGKTYRRSAFMQKMVDEGRNAYGEWGYLTHKENKELAAIWFAECEAREAKGIWYHENCKPSFCEATREGTCAG